MRNKKQGVGIAAMTLVIVFGQVLMATQPGGEDPNDLTGFVSSASDSSLKEALDSAQAIHDQAFVNYAEAKNRIEVIMRRTGQESSVSAASQLEQAISDNNRQSRLLTSAEVRLQQLQREWDRRTSMPEDVKEFEGLLEYRRAQYMKGVGTREEMVAKFKEFAATYPESPLVLRALYDAAMLYTGHSIRETGEEPYLPEKARELHMQIVAEHPDLLTQFVVWSRHELACLHSTADARFQGRLEFYKWLKSVGPEQYSATMKWMGREYQFRETPEEELKDRIDGLLKGTMDSVEKNIVYDAKASSNPEENIRLFDEIREADEARNPPAESASGLSEQPTVPAGPNLPVMAQRPAASMGTLAVSSIICLSIAGLVAVVAVCWIIVKIIRKAGQSG